MLHRADFGGDSMPLRGCPTIQTVSHTNRLWINQILTLKCALYFYEDEDEDGWKPGSWVQIDFCLTGRGDAVDSRGKRREDPLHGHFS